MLFQIWDSYFVRHSHFLFHLLSTIYTKCWVSNTSEKVRSGSHSSMLKWGRNHSFAQSLPLTPSSIMNSVIVTGNSHSVSHRSLTEQLSKEIRRWSFRYDVCGLNILLPAPAVLQWSAITSRQSHHS